MKLMILVFILVFVFCWVVESTAADRPVGKSFSTRSEVLARHGMAATSQPLATQIALDILKKGGTAVDAAIAANAVMGLVEPTGNGMGGDLFAIVWEEKSKALHGLNASGRSPQSLTFDHLNQQGLTTIPLVGPLPVTVPGCVDGWFELHRKFGNLPMPDLLAPAIQYAHEGFPVSEVIAQGWAAGVATLKQWPGVKEVYMPNGRAPVKGELFKNPALARTLQLIAQNGRDAFYRGPIAQEIDRYMKNQGGFLNASDLAAHRSEWVHPVSTNYRGYEVWELPPNTQGIAALQMLNILEEYDLASLGFGSTEYVHLFVEAKKLAFEDRAQYYADPDIFPPPIDRLISKTYAAERRRLIDLRQAARNYPAGEELLERGDTIYLTTADDQGNMVSLIQSNYMGLGSGMTPSRLGFMLQDRGALFSLQPGHPNVYAPGKRPFHTIIPAFVTKDGNPHLSFGVMGGAMQPQGHVQIIVNLIDFQMNLQEAGDAPRIRHLGSSQPTGSTMTDGGIVHLESGFNPEVIAQLRSMGHQISLEPSFFGGYQAIKVTAEPRVYHGASESRKDGQAAGY